MRFPCGHPEKKTSATGRIRTIAGRAAWAACQRCNVIAIVVEPAGGDRRGPTSGTARRNRLDRGHTGQ
jgi:hypothetical protein